MPVALVCLFLLALLYRASHAAKDPNTTLIAVAVADGARRRDHVPGFWPPPSYRYVGQDAAFRGLPQLLNCGAAAFDWRPILLSNGTLAMHNAFVIMEKPMEAAID